MTLVPELFVRRLNKPKGLPINVRDVSVTGDGQTDDYAALNEAVRSAGATGTLYFPAGTYVVGTNLTIPACCIFAFGAKLKPSSGVTVTLSGPVEMAPGESVIATGTAGTVSITGAIESSGGVLDVRAFGAKGDGVTDDTAAVQRAIDAAEIRGGELVFPHATYYVPTGVTVGGNDVFIVGNGSTLLGGMTSTPVLTLNGQRITVRDLTIDGDDLTNRGIRVFSGSRGIAIRGCTVKNITQPGAEVGTAVGIRVDDDVQRLVINGCHIFGISAPVTGIARGVLMSNSVGTTAGMYISITDNTFSDITPLDDGDGIVVQDWATDVYLTVQGNRFYDCAKRAIKIQSPGVIVADNVINVLPVVGADRQYSAISVYASRCTVQGNLCIGGNPRYGIEIGAPGSAYSDITVTGNAVSNLASGDRTESDGIRFFGTIVERVTLTGNTVYFARQGYRFDCGLRRSSLTGNTAQDLTGSVFGLVGDGTNQAADVTITGNSATTVANYFVTGTVGLVRVMVSGNTGICSFGNVHAILTGGVQSQGNFWDQNVVSANRGNGSVTLDYGSERLQRFDTALSANRTVTLNTAGFIEGDRFRIVRTGLGAFTLDVGGLKTIPSATAAFVDVEFDGAAWMLTGYGVL